MGNNPSLRNGDIVYFAIRFDYAQYTDSGAQIDDPSIIYADTGFCMYLESLFNPKNVPSHNYCGQIRVVDAHELPQKNVDLTIRVKIQKGELISSTKRLPRKMRIKKMIKHYYFDILRKTIMSNNNEVALSNGSTYRFEPIEWYGLSCRKTIRL